MGWKGKKWAKMMKDSVCHASYLRNHTSFMVHLPKMMISPGVVFIFFFFLILIFQHIAQNEKQQLHPSCAISQEQYSIWTWFLVHFCKTMISPGFFFIFSKFFQKGKIWLKMTINSVCCNSYLRNYASYDWQLWYTCVK